MWTECNVLDTYNNYMLKKMNIYYSLKFNSVGWTLKCPFDPLFHIYFKYRHSALPNVLASIRGTFEC